MDSYWDKPRSPRKRWYEPVPVAEGTRPYKQRGMDAVEADLRQLERLLMEDGIILG